MITISAKNLGALVLPTFCPRCFWIQRHCKKLPFQVFPGIFSSIDSYTKKITNVFFQKHNQVPSWLEPYGVVKPLVAPHYSKYFIIDDKTGIKLWGGMDEIFQRKDGSYFIVDYKTAKYTENQDMLLPLYEVQLNAYAYIGNRSQFNPVTGIGLVYYEPQTDLFEDGLDDVIMDNGFAMPFKANLHELELNSDVVIPKLLKKAKDIIESPKIPEGIDGCEDCEALSDLIGLV